MKIMDYFAIHIVPRLFRGKGLVHPAETGKLTDMVSCVREYDVNIFFIHKGNKCIVIDAGYKNHIGLLPGCEKIGVDPGKADALFLTHVIRIMREGWILDKRITLIMQMFILVRSRRTI